MSLQFSPELKRLYPHLRHLPTLDNWPICRLTKEGCPSENDCEGMITSRRHESITIKYISLRFPSCAACPQSRQI